MTTRRRLSVVALAIAMVAVNAVTLRGQETRTASPLFFEGDMVRGATGGGVFGPVCVLASQFRRKEQVVWRMRLRDQAGKELDDKGLKSLVVELPDGQKFQMKFGPHPARGPTTDYFWAAAWVIPDSYPTGSFSYKVTAIDSHGNSYNWEPFKVGISQLSVIP